MIGSKFRRRYSTKTTTDEAREATDRTIAAARESESKLLASKLEKRLATRSSIPPKREES